MVNEARPASSGMFHGIDEREVEELTRDLKRIKLPKGESIIAEHSQGDNLYLICKGKVEITKDLSSPDTPVAQLSVLEPGDFFGEMSIIDNEPRSAGVKAIDDVELLVIPKEAFVTLAFAQPQVMYNMVKTMTARIRNTNSRFIEITEQMISKNRLMAIGMAASKIIHDLKTPLTVIVLTAQLMENLFPGSNEFTESIIKQTKLIDQLVREVLDFAKGHEVEPLMQKIDMDAFFKDIINTYAPTLQGREVILKAECSVQDPVYFDEAKIRRVMLNLIKNSSEAIPEQGNIRIIARLQSKWLQISVIDDGPGIPEHIIEQLFKPFVSHGKPHGTGLGLAICQKLVQEHRGRLEYVPLEGGGTRFDIRIPQNF